VDREATEGRRVGPLWLPPLNGCSSFSKLISKDCHTDESREMKHEQVLDIYRDLQKVFPKDQGSTEVTRLIENVVKGSLKAISSFERVQLRALVEGKSYFAFRHGGKMSRPVNEKLFLANAKEVGRLFELVRSRKFDGPSSADLTRWCYSAAISFCCFTDIFKTRDQKTPATYFEYLIGNIIASALQCNPTNQLDVLSGDLKAKLPTDFIFELGDKKTKFHVPVKTSTRERVIQVWAHQRVLDGVYGAGRYRGLLVCLSETKLDHERLEVVEICLPDQWRIYQMFIAKLERIYYLDLPVRYARLRDEYPRIEVCPIGDFFGEYGKLSR
jgi:hypothetical protein